MRTGPMPSKPREVRQRLLVQIALAADAVERLQRPGVGDVAQETHERFALGEVAQAPQRFDDERGVAQPAEAVVPGAPGAERFGNAGGRRGDDRAGVVVRVQLEAERRAQHRSGANDGSAQVLAQARQPAIVCSSARCDRRRRIDVGRLARSSATK